MTVVPVNEPMANLAVGMQSRMTARVENAEIQSADYLNIPQTAFGDYEPSTASASITPIYPEAAAVSLRYARPGIFTTHVYVETTNGDAGAGSRIAKIVGPSSPGLSFTLGTFNVDTAAKKIDTYVGGRPGMLFNIQFVPPRDPSAPDSALGFDPNFQVCCVQRVKLDTTGIRRDGTHETTKTDWVLDTHFPYSDINDRPYFTDNNASVFFSADDSPAWNLHDHYQSIENRTKFEMTIMYRSTTPINGVPSVWVPFYRFIWSADFRIERQRFAIEDHPWKEIEGVGGGQPVIRLESETDFSNAEDAAQIFPTWTRAVRAGEAETARLGAASSDNTGEIEDALAPYQNQSPPIESWLEAGARSEITDYVVDDLKKPAALVAFAHGVADMPLPIRGIGPHSMSASAFPNDITAYEQCLDLIDQFPLLQHNLGAMTAASDRWALLMGIWLPLANQYQAGNTQLVSSVLAEINRGDLQWDAWGSGTVLVPDVTGIQLSNVMTPPDALSAAGLEMKASLTTDFSKYPQIDDAARKDYYKRVYLVVLEQTPKAGTYVAPGSTMELICGGD